MQVGDLIKDRRWPDDGYGIIVFIGDKRTRNPYLVWCCDLGRFQEFPKDYIEEYCEVINET